MLYTAISAGALRCLIWAGQHLRVWLRGVVKDEAVLAQLEEMLGVQAAQ